MRMNKENNSIYNKVDYEIGSRLFKKRKVY